MRNLLQPFPKKAAFDSFAAYFFFAEWVLFEPSVLHTAIYLAKVFELVA
jgi:hypothetical protein